MDHASLLRLFRQIVVAGPPLLLGAGLNFGCTSYDNGCPAPDTVRTVELRPAYHGKDAGFVDASVDDLIARCQASSADCTPLCKQAVWSWGDEPTIKSCKLVAADGGLSVRVVSETFCGGRCPEGLVRPAGSGGRDTLGAWLAANAHLEAASVAAFEILAAELGAHCAPPALIQAARAAIADERRHADAIGRLAASRGAVPLTACVKRSPVRDIEAVATENAVEGCVRETYAALLAYRQARAATDPAIRSVMDGISRDEARHAALAWAVDRWSQALLSPAARRRVRAARHEAIEQFLGAPLATLPRDGRAEAGLPDEDDEPRLAGALGAQLI